MKNLLKFPLLARIRFREVLVNLLSSRLQVDKATMNNPAYTRPHWRFQLTTLVFILCKTAIVADTVHPSSLAVEDVRAAVNGAADGDIVQLPKGEATWTKPLILGNKSLRFVGAGIGKTVITHDISTKQPLISFSNANGKMIEISDLTVLESAGGYAVNGIINGKSVTESCWRIHHVRFGNLRRRGIRVTGYETGLIDNCVFDTNRDGVAQGVTVLGAAASSWARAPSWGTERAVYIEDCKFNFFAENDAAVEGYAGARFVLRHCEINNTCVGAHGLDSSPISQRSTYSWEIYKNTFVIEDNKRKVSLFHQMRGGSGVFFDNRYWAKWEGRGANTFYGQNIKLDAYRATGDKIYKWMPTSSRRLDGSNRIDGNSALPHGRGRHTGATKSSRLADSTKTWSDNQWTRNRHFVWNRSDGSVGVVQSNGTSFLDVQLEGGKRNFWTNGDEYVITIGYPALDQIGRAGPTIFSDSHSEQPSEPVYEWNNIYNEGLATEKNVNCVVGNAYADVWPNAREFIKPGRDFFNDEQKPGYVPLVYPHPRRPQVKSRLEIPKNVRASELQTTVDK